MVIQQTKWDLLFIQGKEKKSKLNNKAIIYIYIYIH